MMNAMAGPRISATRERKLKFMADYGLVALRQAVMEMLAQHGSDWLTDEQIDDITSYQIRVCRQVQRMNRQNRKMAQA
jgi:hypothetical protein